MTAGTIRVDMKPLAVPRDKRLTLFALMSLAYFATSGGAFGLEALVGAIGPGWAVVLIVVAPLIWSMPMALMVAELATLMPEEGGYYIWVREALGPFWAVQQAWWAMASSLALLAIFPVLFVSYLGYFFTSLDSATPALHPGISALTRWLLAVLIIVVATVINLRGSREVGRAAKLSAAFIVGSFVALVVTSIVHGPGLKKGIDVVFHDVASGSPKALLLGFSIIILNFAGWDAISTYAGEVDQPQRNYPRAIGGALIVVLLGYLIPVLAGVGVSQDPSVWSDAAGWPVIAHLIGGHWLGDLLAAAALVSMSGLFNCQLLYVSRLPYVMACDGWLPHWLTRVSPRTGVPSAAVVLFSVIAAALSALSYTSLTVILCLLNVASVMLEFLSLIVLRAKRPDAHRSFKVPGGWWGLTYVCGIPLIAAGILVAITLREWSSYIGQLSIVGGTVLTGILLYWGRRNTSRTVRADAAARE